MTKRRLLFALNLVPLGLSFFLVRRYYTGQVDLDLLTVPNASAFVALTSLAVAGYLNTFWRYILVLEHEGARFSESLLVERLLFINLVSFFLPFGVLNYAAQLALIYKDNPGRLVARAFIADKILFLGVIIFCFLFTFASFTPWLARSLGVPAVMVSAALAANVAAVLAILEYLRRTRLLRFFAVQLLIFTSINGSIAVLLAVYMGWQGFAGALFILQKIFAYCVAAILPISIGGVGPRELALLFDVGDIQGRNLVLNFSVVWFLSLIAAAVILFVARRPVSRWGEWLRANLR